MLIVDNNNKRGRRVEGSKCESSHNKNEYLSTSKARDGYYNAIPLDKGLRNGKGGLPLPRLKQVAYEQIRGREDHCDVNREGEGLIWWWW